MDAILDQVVSKPYADKNLSRSQVAEVWNVAMKSVEETLLTRKACNFPNFGLFSLSISKVDLARPDAKSSVTPTFAVASQFTQAAGIATKKSPGAPNTLPVSQLNVTRIALEAGVSRDQVDTSLKALLRTIHEAVRGGSRVSIDVKVGTLVASSEGATLRFNQRFQQLLQQLEDVAKPAHLRTSNTLDLVADFEASRTAPAAASSSASARSSAPGTPALRASSASAETSFVERQQPQRASGGSAPSSAASASRTQQQQQRVRRPPADQHVDYHEDPDYCETCQSRLAALQDKQLATEQQAALNRSLAQLALEKDAADKAEAARQADVARRKRAEIDEYNRPQMAKSKEPVERPDQFGDLFGKRSDVHQTGYIDKDAYKTMLADQIRDKERRLKKEQDAEKAAAAAANRAAAEAHQREEQRQWEEKRRAAVEHKEFLREQMTTKSDFVPAVLLSAEMQFMGNRLVSTSEAKQREQADGRQRALQQLDAIDAKRAAAERERLAGIAEGQAVRHLLLLHTAPRPQLHLHRHTHPQKSVRCSVGGIPGVAMV
eukprot:TRINITY_DN5615_c0_g2_i2.p1 TRINITY_DN5615_c0_g2~~TRINITY_DN5615_c0_g2_i2.p1  ORF type:complete len:548 (+),score=240.86 TRINITY_DN5615_c0_g2_i2:117-1760(+)